MAGHSFDPTQNDLRGGRGAIYTQFGDPVDLINMGVNVERMAKPTF